jgi:hypothetical protein
MDDPENKTPPALSDLPADELLAYGQKLGLQLRAEMGAGEILRRIRERQELLIELDRQALLDICVWARRPVRQSASKEELAREIANVTRMHFEGLSHAGLVALARLRDVRVEADDDDAGIIGRLNEAEPLLDKLRRKRRAFVGSLLDKMVSGRTDAAEGEYRFLPEETGGARFREQIEESGVVGGIARRIRGVADDYVREKLDEIEARIDRKLDEIDRRLGEWRDQEITNRLRIIKITLIASILVAALSLGYSAVRARVMKPAGAPPAAAPLTGERGGPPHAASQQGS